MRREVARTGGGTTLRYRLYIAGSAPNSLAAVANLRACLDGGASAVEVVDVVDNPQRALNDGILVTPTLVRVGTGTFAMMVGDLRDRERLRLFLGLDR